MVYVSNILKRILFRWCHDIGREQAANKPLLKTVFQVSLYADNYSESQELQLSNFMMLCPYRL